MADLGIVYLAINFAKKKKKKEKLLEIRVFRFKGSDDWLDWLVKGLRVNMIKSSNEGIERKYMIKLVV